MRKTMSIILMSAIIGSTVMSTPVSLFADKTTETKPEKSEAEKKKEEEQKKKDEEKKKEEERIKSERDEGSKKGEDLGAGTGEMKGKRDALARKPFDWEAAYREMGNVQGILDKGMGGDYLKGFEEGFKKAFQKGYGDGFIDASTEEYDIKVIERIAEELAEQNASSDYYNKLPIDIDRHRLTDEQIIAKFELVEEPWYIEAFIAIYRYEYEDKYRKKYRELREDNFMIDAKGYEDGKKVGDKMGEFAGKMDFVSPLKKSDWEGSLRIFEQQKSISDRYFLDREPEQYKTSFITGFREGYREKYHEAYTKSNVDIAERNINYKRIAAKGDKLYFELKKGEGEVEFKEDFEDGDEDLGIGTGNLRGSLTIPAATFYEETYLGISMDRDSFNYQNQKYKPVNHVYNVAINNLSSSIKLEKPLKLELEYYGSERAGIYQLINGEWKYIYTTVSKDSLTAEIPAGHFRGGKYAIFIDEKYKPIEDIKGHWAKEELYTYLRRGYIKGYEEKQGTLYHPNTTMKRAHFVELLGNVLGWDYEGLYDNSSRFKDGQYFNAYKDPINYAANMGYINGGTDGNFKPFDTITYEQVEWILRAVMRDQKINWDVYEKDIKTDKKTQTESIKSKKLPIKRGEVVYMLYELQKENLI